MIGINPHPVFEFRGTRDLEVDLPISPWEAALGAKVAVPTVDGQATLTLKPGAQSGQTLRLRGKGFPNRKGTAGDLFAVVKIVVPETLSRKERKRFEQLRDESEFDPRA